MTAAARPRPPSRLKTYSHLVPARRAPTEYEIATSGLLWYPGRGFEVDVPLADWYRRHQAGGRLGSDDWDRFVDPRETTYTKYVTAQRAREAFVDGLLRTIEERRYDASLTADWVATLERLLPVLRYPAHAMQMLAAYVGQMAPGGRIVVASALQAADEVRRVQRIAERTVQLRATHEGFGLCARDLWEREPAWQPMREALERALVAWDWGEAFVALDLCIAPLFDDALMVGFAGVARRRGDPLLEPLLASLHEDCAWHRAWARALVGMTLGGGAGACGRAGAGEANRAALEEWLAVWAPRARAAVRALDALVAPDSIAEAAVRAHAAFVATLGLRMP